MHPLRKLRESGKATAAQVSALLAENIVFRSPILIRPIEGREVIVDNEQGLIVERTIALRPYPALKLFRDAMYASLKDKLPPDVWDYPTP
jgi:hypothetical protein